MDVEQQTYTETVLRRVEFGIRRELDRSGMSQLDFNVVVSDVARGMAVELRAYLWGETLGNISIHEEWPRDWWQAFKDRWFPLWALTRWPVRYQTIDVEEVRHGPLCPHLNAPNDTHVLFCKLSHQDARIVVQDKKIDARPPVYQPPHGVNDPI